MPQNQPPQSADVDVTPGGQAAGLHLPPVLANLVASLRDERKALLKDMPVTDEATRKYLAHFFFPRLIECVEILGIGLTETYNVASQSLTETSRMREYVDKRIASGAGTDEAGSLRVDPDDLEMLRETLAALGLLLQKKMPDDVEIQAAFNLATDAFVNIAGDGAVDEDEDDEDEDEDEDEDHEDEDEAEKPVNPAGDA